MGYKGLELGYERVCRTQKAWSGLSPTTNPVHLRLWGLSFPSVESQLEPSFLFLF